MRGSAESGRAAGAGRRPGWDEPRTSREARSARMGWGRFLRALAQRRAACSRCAPSRPGSRAGLGVGGTQPRVPARGPSPPVSGAARAGVARRPRSEGQCGSLAAFLPPRASPGTRSAVGGMLALLRGLQAPAFALCVNRTSVRAHRVPIRGVRRGLSWTHFFLRMGGQPCAGSLPQRILFSFFFI